MQKLKLGKYKVVIYAAAILLAGAGVLLTSITVAQGAEQSRVVAEQSENTGLTLMVEAVTPGPEPTSSTTPGPVATTSTTPGPEFITENDAIELYPWVAEEIFGIKVDKSKLTADFYQETAPHEWWIVYGPGAECYIDALSGEVLRFSTMLDKKYTGKMISLEESNTAKYSTVIAEDPNNAYSKMAAEIVNSKLANGRNIESVEVAGIQFVWANDKDGLDPKAKGTISVDILVLMETGRSYRFTFWGTEKIELVEFSSHPTQDACHWYYFYEDQAEEYSGHA